MKNGGRDSGQSSKGDKVSMYNTTDRGMVSEEGSRWIKGGWMDR